jgi:hypothetical protein
MSRARLHELNRARVRKCREREAHGLAWVGFWYDRIALAILLDRVAPRPDGRRYDCDNISAKDLAEGVRELLKTLAAD